MRKEGKSGPVGEEMGSWPKEKRGRFFPISIQGI
jgi:hypothetical protein